ncbi:hypothetical protein SAMN04487936_102225 [Halobacillus dabanensis]|uniref:AraC family transcriptional regulator n=1 Tax=Halobacillus dabanensis TaxID=240302 RepID=A0A1I3RFQ2_HALDA|nr:hypothetical protein [Halobacillus dabanensis]SFJ45085.1 hypothetical protein SAMN04487936_102225 [Halobacillus dabanensis]
MNTLHILNGEEMKSVFQRTGYLRGESMVPFNEAMCVGKTCEKIFSEEFIKTRALTHGVSESDYRRITVENLEAVFHQEKQNLKLWFDGDMFCQINLLTLLGWLDQIGFEGNVELCIVNELFEPMDSYPLEILDHHSLYKQVLMDKALPSRISLPPLRKGIELYLNYCKDDNELVRFIKDHPDTPENRLIQSMLVKFREYGLGDLQYADLIKNIRAANE